MSLVKGKKGLIMGVANERSIAWGISQKLAGAGAELASHLERMRLRDRVADPPTVAHPAPVAMEAIGTIPASPNASVNGSLESIDLDEE